MNKLFLFTNNYPFGNGEEFIETEILFLARNFNQIHIVPLVRTNSNYLRCVPTNVTFSEPMIKGRFDQKFFLFLLGLFNFAPISFALREFFLKKVYKRKKWILNWLSFTCITRSCLSSTLFNRIVSQIEAGDILYFYWADNSSNLTSFLKNRMDNKIVVRFHRGDLYEEEKGDYLPYRERLLMSIDLAVFISQHGKSYLENRYPDLIIKTSISRLGVLDNGISRQSYGETLHIVSCSGISEVKRVHLIPCSLQLLMFKIKWTHFGSGHLIEDVENKIKLLPENITVNLRGHVNNKEVVNFYKENHVDLFINLSTSEGLPVSIMEAMSVGIPVIATNVGGVSEIVTNENGYLMHKNSSINEIAETISHYYKRNDKSTLRTNARRTWEHSYNASKNYIDFCKLIKKIK